MKRFDPWAALAWIVVAVILLLVLTGEALSPAPAAQPSATEEPYGCGVPLAGEPPTARERAARFAAQEEYYRVADLYGDLVGATEAAKLVYEEARP